MDEDTRILDEIEAAAHMDIEQDQEAISNALSNKSDTNTPKQTDDKKTFEQMKSAILDVVVKINDKDLIDKVKNTRSEKILRFVATNLLERGIIDTKKFKNLIS